VTDFEAAFRKRRSETLPDRKPTAERVPCPVCAITSFPPTHLLHAHGAVGEIYRKCRDQTLTPFKEMYAMYEAACYVAKAGIPGDYVECGVWKGGSSMVAALPFPGLTILRGQMF
jgi:hypothetical protein